MTAPNVYVNGVPVTYEQGTLEFDRTVTKRSTARFRVLDLDVTDHLNRLTQCRIHDGDTGVLLWSGYVEQVDETRIGKAAALRVDVAAADGASLLDGRLVADVFIDVDVEDALATVIDDVGAPEGIRFHDYQQIVLDDGPPLAYYPLDEAGIRTVRVYLSGTETFGTTEVINDTGTVNIGQGESLLYGDPAPAVDFTDADRTTDENWIQTGFDHQPGSGDFTVEAWFRRDGKTGDQVIMDTSGFFGSEGFTFGVNDSDDLFLTLWAQDGAGFGFGEGGAGNSTVGEVHHGVVVVDITANEVRTYVDGALVNTDGYLGTFSGGDTHNATIPLYIGGRTEFGGGSYFFGEVGHCAVYDGVLTAQQIADHYEAGSTGYTSGAPEPTITPSGEVLSRLASNYEPATEVINRLADRVTFDWWVDERQVLHWRPRGSADAPATVDASVVLDGLTVSRKNTRYRNQQVVRGGVAETDEQTEEWEADGSSKVIPLGFPVAQEPEVLGQALNPQTVGIKGVDDDDGSFQWFWSKGDNTLYQAQGDSPVTAGNVITVNYVGQFPFVAVSTDGGEQSRVADDGHGSGVVAVAEDVPESTGREEAFDVAASLLARWSQDHRTIKFDTRVPGFAAGQVAQVELPLHGLDDELLLESVDATVSAGGTITYTIKGTEGPFDGRWTEYFEKIVEDGRDFQEQEATDDETLVQQTSDDDESWTITESQVESTQACPVLAFTLPATLC